MYIGTIAASKPQKVAIIRPSTGERRTFRELDDRSNRLAQLFYAQGLRRGDHVAFYAENCLDYFDVTFACFRSGLYLTPINWHLPASEAAYIVDNCDADVLIASAALAGSEELGHVSEKCRLKLSINGALMGFADLEAATTPFPAKRLDEEWLGTFMSYSSGTTGKPKGIKRPLPDGTPEHGNAGMLATTRMFAIDDNSIYLSPAPLYHAAPGGFSVGTIMTGGTVIMMDRFDAETALTLIENYRVTHSQWVPTMFVRMLKLEPQLRAKFDLSSHCCAIHAAAPCPPAVKRQMIEWWGPILEEFYSSTEMVGFARISSAEWLTRPGSVGRSQGLPFHVCDDLGRTLPPGQIGTIYGELAAGTEFSYYKDDTKTIGSSHPEQANWMTVGDVGHLDEDGYLYLTDRKSFMIISGGVNIYPQQIEDVLALHPKITDVAVIGVPHDELGEEIKAVVQPAAGLEASRALEDEIKAYVRERLGNQLTPRSIDFTDALPRLPTGKLAKRALREKYWGDRRATAEIDRKYTGPLYRSRDPTQL